MYLKLLMVCKMLFLCSLIQFYYLDIYRNTNILLIVLKKLISQIFQSFNMIMDVETN